MDPSEVGKFGTLRLMKRLDPSQVVASYPIDENEISIGRDQDCSIRLYYDAVSPQHCKIIFQDRKAYVVVFGTSGVLIDGCPVFPTTSSTPPQVTVPLPNNSTIEINKKRFQFSYPPKELRAMMISTPSRPDEPDPDRRHRRRTLRMSMIQSAHVFTPRPSQDPQQNLRILQTPLKTAFPGGNRRQSSPLKRGMIAPPEEDEEDEEIILVESNHPRVVEEERDLVILEHVEIEIPESEPVAPPQQFVQFPIPQVAQPLQQTPRRRQHPRASLHRAVLIRSAQRAAMRYEMQREEEDEAEEVEGTIVGDDEREDVQEVEEGELEGMEEEDDDEEGEQEDQQVWESRRPVSSWRKSLNAMKEGLGWAFRSSSVPRDVEEEGDEDEEEQDITEAPTSVPEAAEEDDAEELFAYYETEKPKTDPTEEQDMEVQQLPSNAPLDPQPSSLGPFMTPQPTRIGREKGYVRYSAGGFIAGGIPGSGPRRVKVVEPWRVSDIVIDEEPSTVKQEQEHSNIPPSTPIKRERLTEEEKQAIRERRKSALTTPDAFFGGQTPGSRKFSRLQSLSPTKAAPLAALGVMVETIPEVKHEEEEAEEDTQIMLARMKQMVEGVKRRQSMGARPSVGTGTSPRKPSGFSLLAPEGEGDASRNSGLEFIEVDDQQRDGDEEVEEEDVPKPEDIEMDGIAGDAPEPETEVQRPVTPKFTGMREMFREAAEEMHTPKMDGLRHLFGPGRVLETPAYEGVGEMLATPSGYRDEPPIPRLELDPKNKPRPVPARPAQVMKPPSTSRVPITRRVVARPTPRTDSPVEQVSEETESSGSGVAKPKAVATRVTRKPRSKTADTEEDVNASGRTSRTRGTAKESGKQEHVSDHIRDRTRSGGSSKSTTSTEEPPKPTTRRTRKAPDSSTTTPAVEEPPAAPIRSLRKPRTGSKTPVPEEKPPSKPTSSTRRKAKPPVVEDDDPLDSLPPRSESPDKQKGKEAAASGARVRRSARSKVDTIKEEEDEDDLNPPSTDEEGEEAKVVALPPPTRTRITRKTTTTTAPKTVAATTSRATTSRTTRAGTGKKVPASEPVKRTGVAAAPGDKENTPEAGDDDDEPEAGTSGRTGAKVTAKGKTVRGTAKTRGGGEAAKEPEATKTRVSRARTTTRR